MSITVLKPGLLTTIQDSGRYGYQKNGVVVSGAMDVYDMKLANIAVGNDENEDMHAASAAGLNCYLVTDCIIKSNTPWKGDHGSFAEMVEMLKTI